MDSTHPASASHLMIVTEIYEAPQNSLLQVVVQVVALAQK
jgi:hypothetical protein